MPRLTTHQRPPHQHSAGASARWPTSFYKHANYKHAKASRRASRRPRSAPPPRSQYRVSPHPDTRPSAFCSEALLCGVWCWISKRVLSRHQFGDLFLSPCIIRCLSRCPRERHRYPHFATLAAGRYDPLASAGPPLDVRRPAHCPLDEPTRARSSPCPPLSPARATPPGLGFPAIL